MRETEHFVNDGYGWACRRCHGVSAEAPDAPAGSLARFFREGEAEEREARLASPALARWKGEERRTLVCPRCGAEDELPA
ncbi:MAG TPA: hypothetical protein VD968_11420 [Pyrinomonadaceae bacterium]|nr:hypothetical protein [Pyrinomonadaceae bacterium]